jgi:putative ABC transport system permease protein
MMDVTPEEILTKDFQYGGVKGRFIGVVKDFHFESLHEPIVPTVFLPSQFYNSVQEIGIRKVLCASVPSIVQLFVT